MYVKKRNFQVKFRNTHCKLQCRDWRNFSALSSFGSHLKFRYTTIIQLLVILCAPVLYICVHLAGDTGFLTEMGSSAFSSTDSYRLRHYALVQISIMKAVLRHKQL